MDINQFRKHLQDLSEAPKYDGKVNQVVWHHHSAGEAILMIHQKHDKGQHGVDQAAFALLKAHLGPKLQALTKLKIDNTPVRTAEGNYWYVTVEFKTKQ